MEHSRLLQKNSTSTLYVEYDDSLPISYRKLKFTDVIEEMIPENIDYNDVFWVSNVILPNEDCYVILIIYRDNEIIDYVVLRCGVPPLKVFYTDKNYKETDNVYYEQYNKLGNLLSTDYLNYLESGIGYFIPENEFESLIKIYNKTVSSSILKLPYIETKIETTPGSGYSSNGLFVDTGFSNYGFIGEKFSYFDLDKGVWVNDLNRIARAEDLAKAVAFKYNLEWEDRANPLHIYNYIKYFRTYDEENGVFRLYAPSITPSDNAANFELIQKDELDNTFIKGVSMLLVQDLETVIDGSVGVYIPFK